MKTYLCGPINGCTDEECNDWRTLAKQHLADTLDPMRRDYRGREDQCVEEIVTGDKADIDTCDALLVCYDKPSVGTSMEILYAWQKQKLIVIVAGEDARISPWLRYHATRIVNSFEEACKIINSYPSPLATYAQERYPSAA